jgi:microcystin-dependent protein
MVSPQADLIARGLAGTDAELGLGLPPAFRIYIRDRYYYIIDELKEWIEFKFVQRFNNIGTWQLKISTRSLAAKHMNEFSGIVVKTEMEGVLTTIFSGSVSTQWEETSDYISMAGNDDNELLMSTARPNPSQSEAPYSSDYFVNTAIASTAFIDLVQRNLGSFSPAAWRIPQLIMATDPLLGSNITIRARFDTILGLLRGYAIVPGSGGLGFRILQSDTIEGAIEFQIYQPRDMSSDTQFGVELQTASDYRRVYTRPGANYFIIGGGDDFGINRTIVEGGDATNISEVGRRIPVFVDARGITNLSELNQKLAEQLAGVVSSNSVQVLVAQVPSMQYVRNFYLGDVVTAVVRGVPYARVIQDIEFNFDPRIGYQIIPNVADPNTSDDDILVQHLQAVMDRLSNIERNWNVPDDSITVDMLHPYIKWLAGDMKMTARVAAQIGWFMADGTAISRTAYSELFTRIGSTTFNIPDMRGRFPLGASGSFPLGTTGGSTTISISLPNTHSHGMPHTHTSQAHDHPGTHSHGLAAHRHDMTHGHDIATVASTSGKRQNTTTTPFGFDEPNVSSGTEDHTHNIPSQSGDTTSQTATVTGNGTKTSGGGAFDSTESDNNVFPAVYSGSPSAASTATTEPDTNGVSGSITNYRQPYIAVNWEIFTEILP